MRFRHPTITHLAHLLSSTLLVCEPGMKSKYWVTFEELVLLVRFFKGLSVVPIIAAQEGEKVGPLGLAREE